MHSIRSVSQIYNDAKAPWFTAVFKERTVEHHVRVNAQFWCDSMGGGKKFYGGDQRCALWIPAVRC